jgi:ubiquinone/menaquinone biosynthesis C-methylase UbiE
MPTAEEQRQTQKDMWTAVAEAWDKWDDWFTAQSRDLIAWFCRAVNAKPGMRVLDLACGAGQPARTIAPLLLPGGQIVATDISPQMLAVTARKVRAAGLTNVELGEMDLENIQFPDDTFDAVTCRFGLMFCPEPEKAAREIRRVLKPGGRFAVAVWDEPAKNPFFTSIGKPLADFGLMPPPDPKAPGIFRLAPPGELEGVLRAGGFTDLSIENMAVVAEYESLSTYWQIQTELAAPLRAAVSKLSAADVSRLKEAVFAALKPYLKDGRVFLPAAPLMASGSKAAK